MIALCQYILQGGKQCEQAALKGGHYCRHHQIVRRTIEESAPQGDGYGSRKPLPFVFPEDRASVQLNYFMILQAINDGRLDQKTASLMLRVLKACDANLKKGPLNEGAAAAEASEAEETEVGVELSAEAEERVPHTSKDRSCGSPLARFASGKNGNSRSLADRLAPARDRAPGNRPFPFTL